MKTILILGGSLGGLAVAHTVLKKTLNTIKDYKIVLVSTSTHIYWNLASVRAIVPGQISDEKIFQEIQPGSMHYPKGSFEFIHGAASGLDPRTKTVIITTASGEAKQTYDILLLATGTRTTGDLPWKASLSGYQATKDNLHKYQEQVKAAKSIVLGGGGPTGIEAAGELGFEYGKTKEITLITAAPELAHDSLPVNISKVAEKELKKLHVEITKGVKIIDSKAASDGKTELILDNGETMLVDLYLPIIGNHPNSEYVPKALLDDRGYVIVDEYLRVKGTEDIWAVGDVSNTDPSQAVYLQKQIPAIANNLDLVIKGKKPIPYKSDGNRIIAITLGRNRATGRSGNWKLPSIIVWWLKGRTLGTQNMPNYITGNGF
ncbi:FAD/NAD(P)-binding domain-containing protein [Cadophora sp. DSE1049]|nr:FAD/NAD(P)-binding domain-containing protein [Cadophora sp. DSE1049]